MKNDDLIGRRISTITVADGWEHRRSVRFCRTPPLLDGDTSISDSTVQSLSRIRIMQTASAGKR